MTNRKEIPRHVGTFCFGGKHTQGLLYWLEPVPGIPDVETQLGAGIHTASECDALKSVPEDERRGTLTALAETYSRSRYHYLRFNDCINEYRRRRELLGGPVVSDMHVMPAILFEAKAYLGAVRTAVDVIVYLAARRTGQTEKASKKLKASAAIDAEEKHVERSLRGVPEINVIVEQGKWFADLNRYRNIVFHRGWNANVGLGFFEPNTLAEEVKDPDFNAGLLPDADSIKANRRQHEWTYVNCLRLDDLVVQIQNGFDTILKKIIVDIWSSNIPAPGTIPREEQPTAILKPPSPVPFGDPRKKLITPVFDSVEAAEAYPHIQKYKDKAFLREVFPTTLPDGEKWFLLMISNTDIECKYVLQFYRIDENNKLNLHFEQDFDPQAGILSAPGVIPVRSPENDIQRLFVWTLKEME